MMDHHVAAVILLRPEEMLLCHRTPARPSYPDVWDFPGGMSSLV
jgi:8-oxo-dGTP pyrophosphatase MutT (NUDIX family)